MALLAGCGSQANGDRNNATMDAELRAANMSIGPDDGRTSASPPGSADALGQQMRAASTQRPLR
jgi:hypothetical protein